MTGTENLPHQTPAPLPTPGRAAFTFIFITVVLDMLALGIMVPVLPKLILQFQGGNVSDAASITGIFGMAWAAMQFIFSPVLGAASDRFGRRPIILASNLGLGLDYVLMALAPSVSWLFVGRVISGITAASFSTAGAYIADVTPAAERAKKFGMLGAAFGLGFIIGPAIGGFLGGIDLRLPFWVAAALSLLNAGYGYFILPESLPVEKRSKFTWRSANPLSSLTLLRSQPGLMSLAAISVLTFLAHEALPSIFVLYTGFRYNWNEQAVGIALASIGVCTTIVSAALTGPAVARLGERNAVLWGTVFGAIGFAIYGFAPVGGLFLVGIPFVALWGISGPAMQALMTRRIGPSHQGQLQGVVSSLRGVTGMVGPILFTQVFSIAVADGHTSYFPGAAYLLAAAILVLSFVFSWATAK